MVMKQTDIFETLSNRADDLSVSILKLITGVALMQGSISGWLEGLSDHTGDIGDDNRKIAKGIVTALDATSCVLLGVPEEVAEGSGFKRMTDEQKATLKEFIDGL